LWKLFTFNQLREKITIVKDNLDNYFIAFISIGK
jgi:hypothetical protein